MANYEIPRSYEVSRSVLPANRRIVANAIEKLNPKEVLSRGDKENKLREIWAFENGPKIVGYDKMRTEIIDLYVLANNFYLDFFEYRTLSGAEVPKYYEKSLPMPIPINIVSNLGGVNTIVYSDGMSPIYFDMNMYQTDNVKYAKYDLLQGFVDKTDAVNELIQINVDKYIDSLCKTGVDNCFGPFDAHTWVLDSRIKNPPTTNILDLSATCNGHVTKDLFRAIVSHFASMEKKPRIVFIPSARRGDCYDWVSITGTDVQALATVPSSVTEEIWRTGNLPSGAMIPPHVYTSRLEGETPGSIYCYALSDGPIGYFYQKPEAHRTVTKDEFLYWETRTAFTGTVITPAYLKPNIVQVKFG